MDHIKIKTQERPRVRQPAEEPIVELTRLGWVLISPGRKILSKVLIAGIKQIYSGKKKILYLAQIIVY